MDPLLACACVLGLHLASAHSTGGYHSDTVGVYLRADGAAMDGMTGGVLRNSVGRTSFYLGQTWQTRGGGLALTVGAITGYPAQAVSPLVVPSTRWALGQGVALRLAYIPKPPRDRAASALHLALEISR